MESSKNSVLILSSSLLTERMLAYTDLLPAITQQLQTSVWSTSERERVMSANSHECRFERFPAVGPYREFPHNFARRFNEFVWDFRYKPASRISAMKHVRTRKGQPVLRLLRNMAKVVAPFHLEQSIESRLEKMLMACRRSPEALERLRRESPSVVCCTGPFWFAEPAVVAAAKQLGIRTIGMIPSWDNVSTKNRMVFRYDGYIVWSDRIRDELHDFYPLSRSAPVYVVGAPQFDVFFQQRFTQTREEFFSSQGLDPSRKLIVYAIGSPNFLQEHHGALFLAERIASGALGNVQMIVRPHPIHDRGQLVNHFAKFSSFVAVQQTRQPGIAVVQRSQDEAEILEWVNTFRHADVVVNLSSTVSVDAAIFDRPVVNLDYDPQPGQPNQQLVKDVNHLWTHFKPVAESGGLWLVENGSEMLQAVKTYLEKPELHRDKRRWVAEYVCQYLDGRCGRRMGEAIVDFAGLKSSRAAQNTEAGRVKVAAATEVWGAQ